MTVSLSLFLISHNLFTEHGDVKQATVFFENAIRHGAPFEPYYYLAEIHASNFQNTKLPSHMTQGACAMAVSFYKLVAERGAWDDDLIRDGEVRWKIGTDKAKDDAMLRWWIAAERGYETAQNNLAYILDQGVSLFQNRVKLCVYLLSDSRQEYSALDPLRTQRSVERHGSTSDHAVDSVRRSTEHRCAR